MRCLANDPVDSWPPRSLRARCSATARPHGHERQRYDVEPVGWPLPYARHDEPGHDEQGMTGMGMGQGTTGMGMTAWA